MPCLPRWWVVMGLLDGLATAIRFRLSSRARAGAWAGPDAMEVGVVFAGLIDPMNPLPTLIPIRLPTRWGGPDTMLVGVVFTGSPALSSVPKTGCRCAGQARDG